MYGAKIWGNIMNITVIRRNTLGYVVIFVTVSLFGKINDLMNNREEIRA